MRCGKNSTKRKIYSVKGLNLERSKMSIKQPNKLRKKKEQTKSNVSRRRK